jgi:hypothetical protein
MNRLRVRPSRDVFRVAPHRLDPHTVFRRAIETDACDNPISPVELWIDPDGYYTVLVYDAPAEWS